MPLPEVERVIYGINPLDEVICQLRFPPILKIDSEVPSHFQEAIRISFPLYSEQIELRQEIALGNVNIDQKKNVNLPTRSVSAKIHSFSSADGKWTLNLTRTFLSLTTKNYVRWEEFYDILSSPLKALIEIYKPPFFTRIGLRYIDIITRSILGLEQYDWDKLLEKYFIGMLSSPLRPEIKNCESIYQVDFGKGLGLMRLKTGFVENIKLNELCYLIDSDFYTGSKVEIDVYKKVLDNLHIQASRLLRFIITDELHAAMKPQKID